VARDLAQKWDTQEEKKGGGRANGGGYKKNAPNSGLGPPQAGGGGDYQVAGQKRVSSSEGAGRETEGKRWKGRGRKERREKGREIVGREGGNNLKKELRGGGGRNKKVLSSVKVVCYWQVALRGGADTGSAYYTLLRGR